MNVIPYHVKVFIECKWVASIDPSQKNVVTAASQSPLIYFVFDCVFNGQGRVHSRGFTGDVQYFGWLPPLSRPSSTARRIKLFISPCTHEFQIKWAFTFWWIVLRRRVCRWWRYEVLQQRQWTDAPAQVPGRSAGRFCDWKDGWVTEAMNSAILF